MTRDRLDSAIQIAFIMRALDLDRYSNLNVLDIGSGYGRLAHRLCQSLPNAHVWCADAVAEATFVCQFYTEFRGVSERATIVVLDEIESAISNTSIDLAVNVNSFSECTALAIACWIDLLRRHRVPYLMIVPNAEDHGGRKIMSTEPVGAMRRNVLDLLADAQYEPVLSEPKYSDPLLQQFGVSPTYHYLFRLVTSSSKGVS